MGGNAVVLDGINKSFKIRKRSENGKRSRKKYTKVVLEDINLSVKKGEVFGIIGRNGSGKSTLLKIISKIMKPDSGSVYSDGKVASILELGMGFHPDLSGRENIYIKSSMYGFSKKQIDEKIDSIIEYAELEDYIDLPTRIYSSGMVSRLAFSIIININSDIVIVDEVLSTGDLSFNLKSGAFLRNLKSEGKTIILVTHSVGYMRDICDRVAWLDSGSIKDLGPARSVCGRYEAYMSSSPEVIKSLAESGVATSQYELSRMYADGSFVGKDEALSREWLEKSAKAGFDKAQIALADAVLETDREFAIELYALAAKKRNLEARHKLSKVLSGQRETEMEVIASFKKLLEMGGHKHYYDFAELLLKTASNDEDKEDALNWFKKSAELGNEAAMFQVAVMHRDGIGTKRDNEQFIEWLKKSAEAGFERSQAMLGSIYMDGFLVDYDGDEALKWHQLAAENNNPDSQYNLAVMYSGGWGLEKNKELAEKWFRRYSRNNILKQILMLADCYSNGKKVEYNAEEGAKWYECVVEHGLSNPLYELGVMYRDGIGVERNTEKAIDLFWKSSEKENLSAINALINLYVSEGLEEDVLSFSLSKLKRLSEKGNVNAMQILWRIYSEGEIVEKDFKEALLHLERAAVAGHTPSKRKLGEMCRFGQGIEQDISSAKKWFFSASMQGDVGSSASLVNMNAGGLLDEKTFEAAKEHLYNASFSGNTWAMNTLRIMYNDGELFEKDLSRAIKLYEMAAKIGIPWFQNRLGEMYRDGVYVKKNIVLAKKWFISASHQGNFDSIKSLFSMCRDGLDKECLDWAISQIKKLSMGGDAHAMGEYGAMLYYGEGVTTDKAHGIFLLEKASAMGDRQAKWKLSEINKMEGKTSSS